MSQCTSCGGICKKSGCERADYVPPEQRPLCTAAMLDEQFLAKSGLSPDAPLYTIPPQPEKQRHLEGFWCKDLTCKKCYSADFRLKHATPPQRTLVGLTDEEIEAEFGYIDELLRDICYRTQAMLKEKST